MVSLGSCYGRTNWPLPINTTSTTQLSAVRPSGLLPQHQPLWPSRVLCSLQYNFPVNNLIYHLHWPSTLDPALSLALLLQLRSPARDAINSM